MHRRTVRTTALMLAGVMAAVLAPVLVLATPASALTEPYTLTMAQGELELKGSDEPQALGKPTTISGTNTDGALTAGTLSTPTISFTTRVTEPAITDVYIDADFTQVTPGSVAGNIDEDGNVTLTTKLRVDLDVRVQILPGQEFECATSPINLTLEGLHDGDSATLADANFSVPAVPGSGSCPQYIADGINKQLQGSGHAISLDVTGSLTRPIGKGDESVTTLTVSPAGPVDLGDEVTLTATVAPGPTSEIDDVPGGFVTFLDGNTPLGLVPLDENGTAELATSDISAGPRQLRARYEGSAPIYAASTSAATPFQVIAPPVIVTDLPSSIRVGGTPVDFGVEAVNNGFGRDITNARLDVTIGRVTGTGAINANRITLSTLAGDTATPVTLTSSGAGAAQRLRGSIGGAAGIPLPAGQSWDVPLRLNAAANTFTGPLRITFTLVEVDGGGVITSTLAEGSDTIDMVAADRLETQITAGQEPIPEFELPGIPAVLPVRARAGNAVTMFALQLGPSSANYPSGLVRFSIDGRPLLTRSGDAPSDVAWADGVGLLNGSVVPDIMLPRDIGTGAKTLTVMYAGDLHYRPATASFPLIVEGPIAPSYECVAIGTAQGRFLAQVEAAASLPTVARPGSVPLGNLSIRLHLSRATRSLDAFREIPLDDEREIDLEFGPDGSGQADTLTEANGTERQADDGSPIDHTVTLVAPTGQATIAGAPGETAQVTLDTITMSYTETFVGARNTLTCSPLGAPTSLGSVTVAGTTLEATPVLVGLGDDVVLKATSLPAGPGTIEFKRGGTTVGFVPTADGTATLTTSSLPAGTSPVTAIFRSSGVAPTTTSDPVDVRVVGTCLPVEPGNGAAVRLVYMELLRRCADSAGYGYWKQRLDAGTTRERFAREISASAEARGVIVDDAYEMMLERSPDAGGRAFWVDRLAKNGRYDDLLASLAASAEFRTLAGGSDEDVVRRVYERIIGRAPEPGGLAYWVDYLDDKGVRRLVKTIFNQPEPLGVVVATSFAEILDRAPSAEERTAFSAQLKQHGSRSRLYAALIGTQEFVDRAQEFPELPI